MARPDAEDAYEAAMRAADALFTRPASPEPDRQAGPPPGSFAEDGAPTTPPERGGRILRVIDEPPPPEFAALEAAYAPKRRGRKPGSKNKPKTPAVVAADAVDADLPAELAMHLGAHDMPVEPAPIASALGESVAAAPAAQTLRGIAVSDGAASPSAPRGERRSGWLRDRLKPGEGWKRRRLPRVCW